MKRASLTDREKAALLAKQDGLCAMCGFGLTLEKHPLAHPDSFAEFDHWIPVALGNEGKPDSAMHAVCHRLKTANDVKAIAKAKRLHRTFVLGEKRKPKMQSRGFATRWRRKMNGAVERRSAA